MFVVKDCLAYILGKADKVVLACHLRQCLETTPTSVQEIFLLPLKYGGPVYALETGILAKFQTLRNYTRKKVQWGSICKFCQRTLNFLLSHSYMTLIYHMNIRNRNIKHSSINIYNLMKISF